MDKTPHLTKWLAILAMTTAAAGSSTAMAQKFPQTENGTTVYYKLVSACTDYAENPLCLQDESRTNKTYAFTMKALDKDSKNQEWVLICADKEQETYHLRNRSTYRYVSTESSWVGNFCIQSFATRQTASNALTITDLGDDQVAISYEDEYGKRYLSATNIDKAQPDMPSDMKDSQWAWKVFRASDLASVGGEPAHTGERNRYLGTIRRVGHAAATRQPGALQPHLPGEGQGLDAQSDNQISHIKPLINNAYR